jgi:exopolysaccharide biosynthesis polyprenyl glycosylphosphotransferase
MPLVKMAAVSTDAAVTIISFLTAFVIREDRPILSNTAWAWSPEFFPYAGVLVFLVVVRPIMLSYQRLYRFEGEFSYLQDAIRIFKAVAVSSLLAIAWAFLFRGGFRFRIFSYSRGVFALDFIIVLTLLLSVHLFVRYVQTRFRARGINLIPTLIVGSSADAERAVVELKERTDLGYLVVGVAWAGTDDPPSETPKTLSSVPVLGSLDDLPYLIRELHIQEVIITTEKLGSDALFDSMMQIGRKRRVEFRFAPGHLDVLPQKTSIDQIGVLPVVRLFREPLSDAERFIKRTSDVIVSAIAAVILAPIWIIFAALIRLDSRGPVLFLQERVGMDGRVFLCCKFRTMFADSAEDVHREMYKKNIVGDRDVNAGDDEKPVFGKVRDDPRVTRIGRFLRRSSLDELPQLLNVLKGDMSVVGPRPPIPYEVEEYDLWHRKRLDVKPGLTGLWQVSGRNRLTFDEMVKIDLYYVKNWSLWLDLKIILLTLPAIIRGDGAR